MKTERIYKGRIIYNTEKVIYTDPVIRINPLAGKRTVKGYGVEGMNRFFGTVGEAKAYLDKHGA